LGRIAIGVCSERGRAGAEDAGEGATTAGLLEGYPGLCEEDIQAAGNPGKGSPEERTKGFYQNFKRLSNPFRMLFLYLLCFAPW